MPLPAEKGGTGGPLSGMLEWCLSWQTFPVENAVCIPEVPVCEGQQTALALGEFLGAARAFKEWDCSGFVAKPRF